MLNVISDKIYLNGFEVGCITVKEGTSDYDHIVDSILNTKVVQELEQKIKELEDDIWSLNENIETLVNEVSSLEKEKEELEDEIYMKVTIKQ
jgi:predicted nuclease with TOPRIM domain